MLGMGGVAWMGASRVFPICARASARFPVGANRTHVLDVDYSVQCTGWKSGVTAVVTPQDRRNGREVWLTLSEGKSRVSAWIEAGTEEAPEVLIRPEVGCSARILGRRFRQPSPVGTDSALVLAHAPVLVARPDQLSRPDNDTPLITAHQWIPLSDGGRILRYTVYFSDEDSMLSTQDELAHLENYGRYADIEWAYEVEFDHAGKVRDRRFQSGLYSGAGHQRSRFRGEFVAGTDHPVLYNVADHNVFSDLPALTGRAGWAYQGVSEDEIKPGTSRERVLFNHPWIFWASDLELGREGKLARLSSQFQYQEIPDGKGGVKLSPSLVSGGLPSPIVAPVLGRLPSSQDSEFPSYIHTFRLVKQERGYQARAVVYENDPLNSGSLVNSVSF